jgi:hypothetical protein
MCLTRPKRKSLGVEMLVDNTLIFQPEFEHLDGTVQEAFIAYLAERGVDDVLGKSLFRLFTKAPVPVLPSDARLIRSSQLHRRVLRVQGAEGESRAGGAVGPGREADGYRTMCLGWIRSRRLWICRCPNGGKMHALLSDGSKRSTFFLAGDSCSLRLAPLLFFRATTLHARDGQKTDVMVYPLQTTIIQTTVQAQELMIYYTFKNPAITGPLDPHQAVYIGPTVSAGASHRHIRLDSPLLIRAYSTLQILARPTYPDL